MKYVSCCTFAKKNSVVGRDQSYYVTALLSEGNKIEASSVVAAGSDPKIQIKALISQLLSLTQQVVSADSIQAKDAELANKKEEIKCEFS